MQHEIDAGHRAFGDAGFREIALEEIRGGQMIEVPSLAGNQAVDNADMVAAPEKFFREMGTDEAGAAGDEIERHASPSARREKALA